LTLEAPDGRNVSVWFDASIEGLSAASFGMDEGSSVSQISKVKIGGTGFTVGDTVNLHQWHHHHFRLYRPGWFSR